MVTSFKYTVKLVNQYGNYSTEDVVATAYEVADGFVNFFNDQLGYCASYRADHVVRIIQGDAYIKEVDILGDGRDIYPTTSRKDLWYVADNNKLVAPANALPTPEMSSYTLSAAGSTPELDKKLAALSEAWPPFPLHDKHTK